MDISLLRYHIFKNGMSLKCLAKELGITYNALYKKMSKRDGFSVSEIRKISGCLNLTKEDVWDIFFAD